MLARLTVGVLWLGLLASPAQAEQAVGILNGSNVLVSLDTAAPGVITSAKQVTGLQTNERLMALDYRYSPHAVDPLPPPRLFGLGIVPTGGIDTVRLYTIDPGTGAATVLTTAPFVVTPAGAYGMDFNPTVDRIRVVNSNEDNFRINPNSGHRADAPTNDTDLNPAGNGIVALANDRVEVPPQTPAVGSNTTLYGISSINSTLVTIGGVNQTPSPNTGQVLNSKPLGVTIASGTAESVNFDIAIAGTAFITFTDASNVPGLYTVNLGTGAATPIGALPSELRAFTTIPGSTVQFDSASISQPESGPATATVTRSGSLAGTTTVGYATSDGTATAGDYAGTSGTLTFAPDEAAKTITVPLVADTTDEPDETLTLTLSGPSPPMALGAQPATTITVMDDDEPPTTPTPTPTPTPDTAGPAIKLKVRSSMSLARFRKGFKLTLTPTEAASFKAELRGTVKRAQVSAFNLRLATKSLKFGTGARTLTLKPKRRLVGRPRKRFKVRLLVTATDGSGNLTEIARKITVKPRR